MASWTKLFTSITYATESNHPVGKLVILIHQLQLTIRGPYLKSHTSNLSNYLSPKDTLFVNSGLQIDFTFKTRDDFSEERASVATLVTDYYAYTHNVINHTLTIALVI